MNRNEMSMFGFQQVGGPITKKISKKKIRAFTKKIMGPRVSKGWGTVGKPRRSK
jgi:hypothetical protein